MTALDRTLAPQPPTTGTKHVASVVIAWVYALLPANFVPPILAGLVTEFDYPVDVAGYVVTGMTVANAATVLTLRSVVRRGHRVTVARIGIALLAGLSAMAVLAPGPTTIAIALIVGGIGSGAAIAASTAGASATSVPDRTTQIAMIANRIVVALVFLVLPHVGGGIGSVFIVVALLGVAALVGAHWIPHPPTIEREHREVSAPDPAGVRAAAWLLAISFAVFTITEEGTYALLLIFMQSNLPGLDDATVSFMFAGGVFAGLLGAVGAPFALRFIGRLPTLATLLAISILAKLGLVFVSDQAWYIAANLAWGFCFGATIPLVFGLAASLTRSGSAVVLVNGVYVVGVALGPLAATQLIGFGEATFGIVVSATALVSAVALLVGVRRGARVAEAHTASRECHEEHGDRHEDASARAMTGDAS